MINRLSILCTMIVLMTEDVCTQTAESFFPIHIGDRWDYFDFNSGAIFTSIVTKDSVDPSGSHHISYGNSSTIAYKIDTAYNVYWLPQDPFVNYLRYKLRANPCQTWENPRFGDVRWAWVARTESMYVFGRRTVVKVFKYAPGNPCGLGSLQEDWLANGFGRIWHWQEPNDITYLRGCIIAGDTFGIITTVQEVQQPLAQDYYLRQNYPNPFNPSTLIILSLPERTVLTLKVFDLLGREVATLGEGNYSDGTHSFRWDASGFPSGVYLCRMQAGWKTRTIKMLLTK